MDLGIKGRAALVAGSSKGLGLAVAKGLAAEGCDLALAARSQDKLEAVAKEIADQHGVQVWTKAVDLSHEGAAFDLAAEAAEHYGRIDILINNAGGPPPGNFEDLGEKAWRLAAELTLFSAQAMTRAVLPGMRAQSWGRIINMTSVSVKQPLPGLILSNSIRAAVVGWAKTLADEVAGAGITVNNVLPGWMLTQRVEQLLAARAQAGGISREEALAAVVAGIPLGRMGDPGEFAGLVAFLASERAAYITGASYLIDGGLHRGLT
ncbi:MAG: SDR family oxidoreductase [Desulfarculaceae bacterium]|nr:SDR family oxidoreductase [Desulfarculaceae bacterium]MCF8073980.1 SDR family oxidoreductase [Desulfarculaceae bacterium]MCF8102666.1 SDR family oxidoreductase [Desulfarculaceae bacterium]MCF8116093.1 SDR family oxidoreductase [Desulfarculaceae bacterium]